MIIFYRKKLTKAALLLSTLLLQVACNNGDPKEHLQRGVEYFKKGDYEKAKLELKTSSQSDKNKAETYYYLALLDEKNHQYKAMRENLLKVVELEPKNIEARLKLGKLLLPFNEPEAAMEQAEMILKESGQNLDALALKASVFIRQKKQQEALATIENILQKNPKFVDALSLKALVYSENQQLDKALALLDSAMAIDPKNVDLHFFKIQLHTKAKNMLAVMDDYQKLTALYPDNQDYKVILAKLYAQLGKKQEAEKLLRDLIVAAPDVIKMKLLLLDFLMDTSLEKVADHLNQFVEHYKDEPRRLLDLANWAIGHQRFDDAIRILTQVVDLEGSSNVGLSAKILLAKIALDKKELNNAEKLAQEILEDNSNYNDAKILQARVLLEKKQYDKAIELLNKVLLSEPEMEEALVLLGQSFLATGAQKKAYQYFENTLKIDPSNEEALSYLYNKALADKKIKYAKEMAAGALRYRPNNLGFLEKLANAGLLDNDVGSAKAAVQRISESSNPLANDLANYLQARIFQVEGDCNKAIILYKQLLLKFPNNNDTLENMAQCFTKLNKSSDMAALLIEMRAANPSNLSVNLLLADLWLHDKKFTEGVDLLTKLINDNKTMPQVYIALAKFKLAQNDNNAALAVYQEGLKQNPDDIKLSLALASLYEKLNEYNSAVSVYQTLLDKHPNLEIAINNLAVLWTEKYSDAETLDKVVKLTERFKDSDQPYYKDTYAWALTKKGDPVTASTVLQEVITVAPDVPIFRYHLGFAYAESQNNAGAIAELQQALELAKIKGGFPGEQEAKALSEKIVAKTRGH